MVKKTKQPKVYRYRYTFSNPITGLRNFSRVIFATDDDEAKQLVKKLARCFGRSTKIDRLVRLKHKEE